MFTKEQVQLVIRKTMNDFISIQTRDAMVEELFEQPYPWLEPSEGAPNAVKMANYCHIASGIDLLSATIAELVTDEINDMAKSGALDFD